MFLEPARTLMSALWLNTSERFIGRQFKLSHFRIREAADAIGEAGFLDGPHLKGKGYRRLRRPIRRSRRARSARAADAHAGETQRGDGGR